MIDAVFAELPEDLDAVAALNERGDASTTDYLEAVADTLQAAEQALLLIKHPGFREEQETRRTTVVFGEGSRAQALTGLARRNGYGMAPVRPAQPHLGCCARAGHAGAGTGCRSEPWPSRRHPTAKPAEESLLALLDSHGMPHATVRRSGIPFRG